MVYPGATGSGGSKTNLEQYHADFKAAKVEALANDEAELNNALDSIQDGCLRGSYDADSTQKAINGLKEKLNEIERSLDKNLEPIYEMKAFADDINSKTVPGWEQVASQQNSILQEMDRLQIPDWQGTSGEAYRAHIARQQNDLRAQLALGESGKRAIADVATTQLGIITITEGFADAGTIAAAKAKASTPPESFNKGAWINPAANHQEFSFQFFTRTAAMINAFSALSEASGKICGGEGWNKSADEIKRALDQAMQLRDNPPESSNISGVNATVKSDSSAAEGNGLPEPTYPGNVPPPTIPTEGQDVSEGTTILR